MIKTVTGKMIELRFVDLGSCPEHGAAIQLLKLVSSLVYCINNNITLLMVGSFRLKIFSDYFCNFEKIFYTSVMNEYLRDKYNVGLIDITNSKYKGKQKKFELYVLNFSLNDSIKLVNTKIGKDILNHILFTPDIVSVPMKFLTNIIGDQIYEKVNIIHLRLENDAIHHWSLANERSPSQFRKDLAEKYIQLIEKFLPKNEHLFVLGNDISNPVIEYLQSKQYSYHHLKKISKYSEVNSIMNLILGKMCNGIFIGARGTAFTHVLQIYYDTDDRVTSYFVNMDNIDL